MKEGQCSSGGFVPKKERQKACDNFRATHFILGKHSTVHHSTNNLSQMNTFKTPRPMTALNSRQAGLNQIATHFKLGDPVRPEQQYSTLYGALLGSTAEKAKHQEKVTYGEPFAKKTSV